MKTDLYKPYEVAQILAGGPRSQDMVQFSEFIAKHLNLAVKRGMQLRTAENHRSPCPLCGGEHALNEMCLVREATGDAQPQAETKEKE